MYVDADKALMEEYGVDYVFVGHCEYEKYSGEGMDAAALMDLGEVIYTGPVQEDGTYTFIVRLN